MKIITQDINFKIQTRLVSAGALWMMHFKKYKTTISEAQKVVYLNQMKFIDEDRFAYYKQKNSMKDK